jgi:hypothetical protein
MHRIPFNNLDDPDAVFKKILSINRSRLSRLEPRDNVIVFPQTLSTAKVGLAV